VVIGNKLNQAYKKFSIDLTGMDESKNENFSTLPKFVLILFLKMIGFSIYSY